MKFRKLKTILCLILIPVLAAGIYFLKVPGPLSLERAFRRAEKAAMVGPGQIIATIADGEKRPYLIAARSQHGVMLYRSNNLIYRKTGEAPVIMADTLDRISPSAMPVFLFHNCEGAVTAKLEFTVQYEGFEKTYHLESEAAYDGLFQFSITVSGPVLDNPERQALDDFYDRCCGYGRSPSMEVPATIRFYDSADNLLQTQETAIRSFAGEADAEKRDQP